MTEFWRQYEGQIVDGTFRLGQFLGGDEISAVFLTLYSAETPQKVAIKLTRADSHHAELQLRLWKQVAKLSHPHLMRLIQTGKCELSNLPLLYVVMEYADEDLAKVIPQRPITATEARELLEPALSALSYLHAKGFVHGHLKPANFMAVDGQLRISSDGVCRIEESAPSKPDSYSPPEIMASGPTTAGDVWSLGMTLVEALTQRLPAKRPGEPKDPALPESIPAPFSAIARYCLKWNPQSRWTVSAIRKQLAGGAAAPEQQPAAVQQSSSLKWVWVSTTVLSLVLLAMIVVPKLRDGGSDTDRAPAVVRQPEKSAPAAPDKTAAGKAAARKAAADKAAAKKAAAEKAAADKAAAKKAAADKAASDKAATQKATAEKAAADKAAAKKAAADKAAADKAAAQKAAADKAASDKAAAQKAAAQKAAPTPPRQPEPSTAATGDEIVQRDVPEALPRARNSIRGKVTVIVKVRADASGNVADAEFDNQGPSQYFADLAMAAARRWKFAPSSAWKLRFEFRKAGTTVIPSKAAP